MSPSTLHLTTSYLEHNFEFTLTMADDLPSALAIVRLKLN